MLFFLRSWCYFSSSAVALLVGISKFKHIYEAELQLSTRFPFHCQDRFPRLVKRGSENEVKNSVEKVVPKSPQMDPKSRPKSTERVFWRGSKEGPKKGTLSRTGKKWDFAIIYYTLARSEVSEKVACWASFWSRFWRQNNEKKVPEQHQKKCWK